MNAVFAWPALALSISSALCFGIALITSRIALRTVNPRAGAAISIPSATIVLVLLAPFVLDSSGFSWTAALAFALVGVFFPSLVTIVTFRSNAELGPTITSAIASTAPLFALPAALFFLGEHIPREAALAAIGIVAGVTLITWRQGMVRPGFRRGALLWPVLGAVLRGVAQAGAKAALLLWPNPFAASLIGYAVSSAVVIGSDRIANAGLPRPRMPGLAWFALTGVLNGAAVLLLFCALNLAPVSLVAPIIAAYPLVTVLASALLLRDEPITPRMIAGSVLTVTAVIYLVTSRAAG